MTLLHSRGGYLYQHRPDLFPQGFLTHEELALWGAFYEMRNAEMKHGRRN